MGVSRPALSQSLKTLEKQLGVRCCTGPPVTCRSPRKASACSTHCGHR
ncbi:hypothetical protein [Stenotrophomonas sp. NRRL B-14846]